jgi:hypothetical protein
MYFARRSLITLLLLGMVLTIVLTACGGQPAATESPADVNATVAAAAATLAEALFQTQTALAPTVTNTSAPTVTPISTNTALALPSPLATSTQQVLFYASPTPTGTFYTLTPSSSSLAVGCSNMALVRDVTIPSGTQMKPGETFTKTWQVANTGTCAWVYSYSLALGSGERMSGNGYRLSDRINVPVPVGEWRQLSVEMQAPNEPGTYTSTWRVTNGDGKAFGSPLGVSIVVKKNPDPTSTVPTNTSAATPNLQQTADAANTALAAQQAAQTQTAAAQTAISVGQTAIACQTAVAQGTPTCP